jgi:hypothetical protein
MMGKDEGLRMKAEQALREAPRMSRNGGLRDPVRAVTPVFGFSR